MKTLSPLLPAAFSLAASASLAAPFIEAAQPENPTLPRFIAANAADVLGLQFGTDRQISIGAVPSSPRLSPGAFTDANAGQSGAATASHQYVTN